MIIIDRNIPLTNTPKVFMDESHFESSLKLISSKDGVEEYLFEINADYPQAPPTICIQWRLSSQNIKGLWSTNALHEKRLMADWELPKVVSRVSVDAPILCVYGHDDSNVITFACEDVVHAVEMYAGIREENGNLYCKLNFFAEESPLIKQYATKIFIDKSECHFSESIQKVEQWWSKHPSLIPAVVPDETKLPVYSTWYSYHQNFTIDELRNECIEAIILGYKVLIVDDGWETIDGNRGYDFTGDWEAVRIPETRKFVEEIQQMGMKVMFWYSVPFCGKKSKAYQRFKGKFLTETHPWAPVFDPRFPDVRQYLVSRYVHALNEWGLDGFKLDFIDDFKPFDDTDFSYNEEQDISSINEAANQLLEDIRVALFAINPHVLIEFRQKYIGPAVRRAGNMFRAFDCPYDSQTNRIRTTDVRLLAGNSAVHSDMLMWNFSDSVESAALQFLNVIFSVPQLSVKFDKISEEHKKMIGFYTKYWLENRDVLMNGKFIPQDVSANYPVISSSKNDHIIFGIYNKQWVELSNDFDKIDLINGKLDDILVVNASENLGNFSVQVFDCQGNKTSSTQQEIKKGITSFQVPPCGILILRKLSKI
jgi:alpha-galactosidase